MPANPFTLQGPRATSPASRVTLHGSRLTGYVALLLTLLSFALSVHTLAFESLDIDEADIVAFARLELGALLPRLLHPGENGPLYIIMLRGWAALAGESEFALRFISVVPAVLSVPLVAVLGRRLIGPGAGLAAALLLACSSYMLFYAQMVKMYSLLLFLALLSSYLLLNALERGTLARWGAYVAATTLAMQVHVFGVLLVPWHAAFLLLMWLGRPRLSGQARAPAPHVLLPLTAFAVLVLPYLPLALGRVAALQAPETLTRQFTGPRDPLGMLTTLAREYGTRFDQLPGEALAWVFMLLTAAGFIAVALHDRTRGAGFQPATPRQGRLSSLPMLRPRVLFLFLFLGLAVPLGLTYALVALGAPLFSSRYQLVTLPVFYLAWGAAIAWCWAHLRPVAVALVLGFVLLNGARWWQTAVQGERFREDWRSAVAYLESRQRPGDPVLVLHDASFRAVDYYRTQPMALVSLERGPEQPPDLSRAPSFAPGTRGWLLTAFFEAGDAPAAEVWLNQRSQLTSKAWLPGIVVSEYRAP